MESISSQAPRSGIACLTYENKFAESIAIPRKKSYNRIVKPLFNKRANYKKVNRKMKKVKEIFTEAKSELEHSRTDYPKVAL